MCGLCETMTGIARPAASEEQPEMTTEEVRESLKNVGALIFLIADTFTDESARYMSLLFQNSMLVDMLIDMNLQMGNIDAVSKLTAMLKKNVVVLYLLTQQP